MSSTCKENWPCCKLPYGCEEGGVSPFQAFSGLKPDVGASDQGRWVLLHPNPPPTSSPASHPSVPRWWKQSNRISLLTERYQEAEHGLWIVR